MGAHRIKARGWTVPAALLLLGVLPFTLAAQGTGGPTISESSVGYIDPAIPGNVLRRRMDAAFDNNRPNRAEFFYAQNRPGGPGLPLAESNVDFQELSSYLEVAPVERFSAFVELPERFLNPEVNRNAAGLGDMNTGFKYAFLYQDDLVTTFQLRTWIPTGDATRGLGNNHVSIEPGLLCFKRLDDRLTLNGELRLWVPAGGTDFAGNIFRYGLGVQYDLVQTQCLRVTPVVEFVGWTVLDGKESRITPVGSETVDASGDTILNLKLGVRTRVGAHGDIYTGYGRSLTGERWYQNDYRLEFRLLF